jgi:hypothetical protein
MATGRTSTPWSLPGPGRSPFRGSTPRGQGAHLVARAANGPLGQRRPLLEAAALLVLDDPVVLGRSEGPSRMATAVACFPSHWSPPGKLGLPITDVHGPAPRHADELSDWVERLLDHLRPDRPVWRRDWTVHVSPELHAPYSVATAGAVATQNLWRRNERQVFAALPISASILFTIATSRCRSSSSVPGLISPLARPPPRPRRRPTSPATASAASI